MEGWKCFFAKYLNFTDFTLPGFHYLGPGSKTDNGPPTNTIDAIAKKHDEAYDQAVEEFVETHNLKRSVQEIEHADQEFLQDIQKTSAETPQEVLGKAVGLLGIGLKATVEKSLGYTFYPKFDEIKESKCEDCSINISDSDDFKLLNLE